MAQEDFKGMKIRLVTIILLPLGLMLFAVNNCHAQAMLQQNLSTGNDYINTYDSENLDERIDAYQPFPDPRIENLQTLGGLEVSLMSALGGQSDVNVYLKFGSSMSEASCDEDYKWVYVGTINVPDDGNYNTYYLGLDINTGACGQEFHGLPTQDERRDWVVPCGIGFEASSTQGVVWAEDGGQDAICGFPPRTYHCQHPPDGYTGFQFGIQQDEVSDRALWFNLYGTTQEENCGLSGCDLWIFPFNDVCNLAKYLFVPTGSGNGDLVQGYTDLKGAFPFNTLYNITDTIQTSISGTSMNATNTIGLPMYNGHDFYIMPVLASSSMDNAIGKENNTTFRTTLGYGMYIITAGIVLAIIF